jgi:NADH-quinone oxidoreductase subunit F
MPHQLEKRVLLEGAEDPRLAALQGYRDLVGGYGTLERAYKDMEQDEVLKELEESGLRGRGGAGFSMGKKASFLPRGEMAKYLCCNADESEPGAFKDRELMQRNPHQLIEGIAIAALAADAGASTTRRPTSSTPRSPKPTRPATSGPTSWGRSGTSSW